MNIYILFEIDYEKNSHLYEIYQSRQVEKDDKMYFYEYRNIFQCDLYYKIPLSYSDWKAKLSFQNVLINLATVNVMLKCKVNGNCK